MAEPLYIRMTNKYVGTYQHEDQWNYVGQITRIQSHVTESDDPEDATESMTHVHEVEVSPEQAVSEEQVAKAIRDHYTKAGCHHEYDCCGCRSFYASKPDYLGGNRWEVKVNSFRNY